jgi:hypothetical protein
VPALVSVRQLVPRLQKLGGVPPVSQSAEAAVRKGEICLRVGFIVTNLAEAAENVVAFRKKLGTRTMDRGAQGGDQLTRLSIREVSEDLGSASPLQTRAAYLSAIGRKPFAARFV